MATKREDNERYYTWVLRKMKERGDVMKDTAMQNKIDGQEYLAREAGFNLEEFGKDQTNIVTSPQHYTKYDIEPIVFIMKNKLDYWRGAIIKYVLRAGSKFQEGKSMEQSEIDDLNKIIEYALFRKRQLEGENIVAGERKRNETRNDNFSATKKS